MGPGISNSCFTIIVLPFYQLSSQVSGWFSAVKNDLVVSLTFPEVMLWSQATLITSVMDEDKVFHSTHAPVLHESLLMKSLWSVLEVSAKIHVVISGLSLRILVGHSALPSVVPVPKSKLLVMQQQIFSPFC